VKMVWLGIPESTFYMAGSCLTHMLPRCRSSGCQRRRAAWGRGTRGGLPRAGRALARLVERRFAPCLLAALVSLGSGVPISLWGQEPVINEFMAENSRTLRDEDGE